MAMIFKSAVLRTSRQGLRPAPSMFYLPGVETRPWWPTGHKNGGEKLFPWLAEMKENVAVVRDEFQSLLDIGRPSDYDTKHEHSQLHSGRWEWHSFIQKGEKNEEFRQLCPRTSALLEGIPELMTGIPFAYAFFSSLHGGTSISSHTGPCNLRLRCHFPIIVPESDASCGIDVGGQVRQWSEAEPIIFDDSYVHRTWNDNDTDMKPRVVLLFDIWHPGVHPDERIEIVEMFGSAREKGWLND